MMAITRSTSAPRRKDSGGFSLIEVLVSMAILTVVIGGALAGMSNMMTANEMVLQTATMNNSLRTGMDLIIRDLLQVGSGLPSGHNITIPNGAGSIRVNIPGPPGTAFQTTAADSTIPAVIPRPGAGPVINGVPTDVITVLMADNTFLNVPLSAVATTTVDLATVANGGPANIATGPDRVSTGQLMMISKGSFTTLVQVTAVNTTTRRLTFANGDSLNLNQSGAASGNLPALNAAAPINNAAATNITRIRMITYYVDASTDPRHPRLVRRINNGNPTTFNNMLGTAVAMDIENFQLSYDISNGTNNPGNVKMIASDLTTAGACSPVACASTQIRKVNIALSGRNRTLGNNPRTTPLRNTLQSQVALRGMAFVDRYRG
jgi:prepilin-type N-terminal cleavage/methylation domain-containing protein